MRQRGEVERLFRDNYARLYRTAFAILRDEEASRDIVSEVFAKFCRTDSAEMMLPEAFLFACVRNMCYNEISRKSLHERLLRLYPLETKELSAESMMKAEERVNALRGIIDRELPARTKEIFLLRFDEEKSYKEMAAICGVSVSAVNKHIVKALRILRDYFQSSNYEKG